MTEQWLEIPLFPLNTVLFPKMVLPLHIFEERYKKMIRLCLEENLPFGVCLIESGEEVGAPAIPCPVGTTAEIVAHQVLEEGRMNISVVGKERFHILEIVREQPYIMARVESLAVIKGRKSVRITSLANEIRDLFKRYMALLLLLTRGWTHDLGDPRQPLDLAYYVAARLTTLTPKERQTLLEQESLEDLLRHEVVLLHREIGQLQNIATMNRRGN